MRLSTFITVACIAAAAAHANEHPAKLVGRWRSENMPVGYWVTDRYANGRLAKKQYVGDYSDEPAEITVTWGRWRLRGKAYSEFFESATSHHARAYCGKWWKMQVQRITPQCFFHLSGDGHDTYEDRFADSRPLLEVHQPPPKEYRWRKLIDTIKPSRAAIPAWVNSVPRRPAPNEAGLAVADLMSR